MVGLNGVACGRAAPANAPFVFTSGPETLTALSDPLRAYALEAPLSPWPRTLIERPLATRAGAAKNMMANFIGCCYWPDRGNSTSGWKCPRSARREASAGCALTFNRVRATAL